MNRTQALVVLTLGVIVAAGVVPAAAGVGTDASQTPVRSMQDDPNPGGGDEGTPWLAPGTGGKANQGREDDEKQQFPGNTSFRIDDHAPGATENSYNIFAVGFSENINMHWNVVRQEDFRWDSCTSTDATAFGIDRGNDQPGTETDQSLLDAYQSVTYTEDGIFVKFFKSEGIAGGPVNITVNDQIVSRVTNCLENPSEPGWYRMTGYINGSTGMDETTDYTIYGAAKYVYVCEGCETRQDAIDKLGPPPTTCPPTDEFARDSKEWTCRTEDGEYYNRSSPPSEGVQTHTAEPTETPPPGATRTPTPTPVPDTATRTATSAPADTATPTATRAPAETPTSTAAGTPTAMPTAAAGDPGTDTAGGGASGNDGGPTATTGSGNAGSGGDAARQAGDSFRTPTVGDGPGFGAVLALVGAVLALLAARPD